MAGYPSILLILSPLFPQKSRFSVIRVPFLLKV